MSEPTEIRIDCVLCNAPILYPPEREGEEVQCPHCGEHIYLLSDVLPEAAPIKQLEPEPEPQPKTKTKKEPQLHAATEARLSEEKKSKATIKGPKRNPAATPPNRKKISPPESKVLKIDHIFPPVDLDKDGTPQSHAIILRHPDEFTFKKSGGLMGGKGSQWSGRWIAVHMQERTGKPWVSLHLEAKKGEPFVTRSLRLSPGIENFELATDAECSRRKGETEEPEPATEATEKFSLEHDDFRFLCAQMVMAESLKVEFDAADFEVSEDLAGEFREYTLEFFEALRREYPIFFR